MTHKKNLRRLWPISLLLFSGFLFSCEDLLNDEEDPTPDEVPFTGDTLAIKEGKGFTTLAIMAAAEMEGRMGAQNGFQDELNLADLTLNSDGKTMHFALASALTTLQSPLRTLTRFTMDINTRQFTPASNSDLGDVNQRNFNPTINIIANRSAGFVEGTNQFYEGFAAANSFGIVTAGVRGDLSYNRSHTFAALPRVTAAGEVLENTLADNFKRIDGDYSNRIFFAYRSANKTTYPFQHDRVVKLQSDAVTVGQLETSEANSNNLLFFAASAKHIYVAEIPLTHSPTSDNLVFIDSIALPAGWSSSQIMTRRSEDGNRFGVAVSNGDNPLTLYSATFDKNTKKLTANILGLGVPNFNMGRVNYDLDEFGNFYFDNKGNNFTSDSTISIYKASGSTFTTVGMDDILKSGTITQIRYIQGKVYAGVSYGWRKAPNGFVNRRVAIIREN